MTNHLCLCSHSINIHKQWNSCECEVIGCECEGFRPTFDKKCCRCELNQPIALFPEGRELCQECIAAALSEATIVLSYQDQPIGAAQDLQWRSDGKLYIGRWRFSKEKMAAVFKKGFPHQDNQIQPFDIEVRQRGTETLILREVRVFSCDWAYLFEDWVFGENIYLTLPKRMELR
jgi:hypothetical protein